MITNLSYKFLTVSRRRLSENKMTFTYLEFNFYLFTFATFFNNTQLLILYASLTHFHSIRNTPTTRFHLTRIRSTLLQGGLLYLYYEILHFMHEFKIIFDRNYLHKNYLA